MTSLPHGTSPLWRRPDPSAPPSPVDMPESADVVVVPRERNRVGSGTSGRTTAKVSALHGTLGHRIRAEHGTQTLRDYVEANKAGLDLVAEVCAETSVQTQRRDAWT